MGHSELNQKVINFAELNVLKKANVSMPEFNLELKNVLIIGYGCVKYNTIRDSVFMEDTTMGITVLLPNYLPQVGFSAHGIYHYILLLAPEAYNLIEGDKYALNIPMDCIEIVKNEIIEQQQPEPKTQEITQLLPVSNSVAAKIEGVCYICAHTHLVSYNSSGIPICSPCFERL